MMVLRMGSLPFTSSAAAPSTTTRPSIHFSSRTSPHPGISFTRAFVSRLPGGECKGARTGRFSGCRDGCNLFLQRTCATGGGRASGVDSEQSSMANEEIVLFLFQLQLDQEMQRAMTYENYQAAMQMRSRREQVEAASGALQDAKGQGSGAKGRAQLEAMDVTTEGLQIRTELQKAIDEERYADAAKYRDQLKDLEDKSKAAEASIEEAMIQPQLRLGQRVSHKTKGYRGVVHGWDVLCCESDEWKKKNSIDKLSRGMEQIYYHVLVDVRDWEHKDATPVAYIAEELITAPSLEGSSTWVEEYGPNDTFSHPYATWLFLGKDAAGDYIPCSQLRNKYNVERWDVYPPGEGGEPDDSDDPESPTEPDSNGDTTDT